MPYVPPEEKERIKREVSIERLAEARGIKLRRVGRSLMGLCPFHEDRNPSLSIDPVKNEWHCFGCDRKGDVIEWVKCAEGVSFHHALELLKRNYIPSTGPVVKIATVPKLPCPVTLGADDRTVMLEVVAYYHRTFNETPEAMRYLEKRGLQSAEMVERFKLGFSDRMLGPALQDKNRRPGKEIREQLERLGVFRASGHEHLRGSIVVPVFNLDGDVVEMYGRKINDNLRAGTEYHVYLPGPMRGVWNEEALIASKEIILCEALIDAMTFWCAGYRQVTASYGVNGFTRDHRAAFERHGIKRVYIAYDADEAGNKAAEKLAAELMERGVECFRVQFPKGQDANEYALKTQPAAKALGVLLTGAAWMGKGPRPAVRVPAPVAAPPPPMPATPAADEPTAKEKIIEETAAPTAKPMPAPTPKPEPQQQPQPEPQPAAEPVRESIPAAVVSDPSRPDQPQQQRVFSLAVNALPSEEPGARPMPLAVPTEPKVESDGEEVKVTIGPREYRVLWLEKSLARGRMQVNVKVSGANVRGEWRYHGDSFDMESAQRRAAFIKQAAYELAVKEEAMHADVGRLWAVLQDKQRERIAKALAQPEEKPVMTDEEQAAALDMLRSPRLLERVLEDFEKCGVVGEEANKRIAYLAAVSRLLEKPLAIVVQSASSAGKSSLMEAALDFMPEEQRESYTAMTGQALFYMSQKNLKHKILAISEQQGAEAASYPLKLLQSEGALKIASTGKDPVSGKLVTHDYEVEGPVMLFLTTTAQEVDEELLNRAITLTVNEDREQTRAIHRRQREARTIEGHLLRRKRAKLVRLHRNAQRLLRPVTVVNNHDVGEFPDYMTRARRDHNKLLTLIDAIALLHQHQRETKSFTDEDGEKVEYIEATEADVKLAQTLADQVGLKPSLDELRPQARRLLALITEMVKAECERREIEPHEYRFTRRMVRECTKWGDTQLRQHLRKLEEMEYLIVRRGGNQGQLVVYQLAQTDGEKNRSDNFAGSDGNFAWASRALRGPEKIDASPTPAGGSASTSRLRGNAYTGSVPLSGSETPVVAVPRPNGAAHGNGMKGVK